MLPGVSAVINACSTAHDHGCHGSAGLSVHRSHPMTRRPACSRLEMAHTSKRPRQTVCQACILWHWKRQTRPFQLPRVAGQPTLGGAPRPMPQRRLARSAIRVSMTFMVAKKKSRIYGHFQLPWHLLPPVLFCLFLRGDSLMITNWWDYFLVSLELCVSAKTEKNLITLFRIE